MSINKIIKSLLTFLCANQLHCVPRVPEKSLEGVPRVMTEVEKRAAAALAKSDHSPI